MLYMLYRGDIADAEYTLQSFSQLKGVKPEGNKHTVYQPQVTDRNSLIFMCQAFSVKIFLLKKFQGSNLFISRLPYFVSRIT